MPRFEEQELKRLRKIKGTKCCNCNNDVGNNIIFHHIIPLSIGGNNIDSNIVPLCSNCHYKIHNISKNNGQLSHSELTKIGIEKARARGSQIGRKKGIKCETKKSKEKKNQIYNLSQDFLGTLTDKEIIEKIQIARNTYYKYKKELRLEGIAKDLAAEPDMEEAQDVIESDS